MIEVLDLWAILLFFSNTGPHFNPARKKDRASEDVNRHADDLGNVIGDDDGMIYLSWLFYNAALLFS